MNSTTNWPLATGHQPPYPTPIQFPPTCFMPVYYASMLHPEGKTNTSWLSFRSCRRSWSCRWALPNGRSTTGPFCSLVRACRLRQTVDRRCFALRTKELPVLATIVGGRLVPRQRAVSATGYIPARDGEFRWIGDRSGGPAELFKVHDTPRYPQLGWLGNDGKGGEWRSWQLLPVCDTGQGSVWLGWLGGDGLLQRDAEAAKGAKTVGD